MSKADKRQRQRARRAAAEAARRRAEIRRRRIRAGIVLAVALAGIAVIAGLLMIRSKGNGESTDATVAATPLPPVGEGISCVTPLPPNPKLYPGIGPMKIAWDSRTYKAIVNTNYGAFEIDLYAQDAPITVNNFVSLACDGFYNSTAFHRVTASPELSVIQGGDAISGDGSGDIGYQIPDELSRAKQEGYKRGNVAMANRSSADTGSSQFFIVVKDSVLSPSYTVFGRIAAGMDVIDTMYAEANPGQSGGDTPAKPLLIESVTIVEQAAGGLPPGGLPPGGQDGGLPAG